MSTRLFAIMMILLLLCAVLARAEEALETPILRFEAGDLDAARTGFEDVLQTDPQNPVAMYYLGRIFLQQDELDDSIDRFERAVKVDPENADYHTWLGRAYIAKVQTVSFMSKARYAGRALDHLEIAVALDPASVPARTLLAGYYMNAPAIAGGSPDKAMEQAREVVKYDAVQGHCLEARVYMKNEDYGEAADQLRACIEVQPEAAACRYQLGVVYQQLGEYEAASDAFEQTLAVDDEHCGALYQIGKTAVLSGENVDRGIECLRLYLTREVQPGYPGYDGAHWRLGMLFEQKQDLGRARAEYALAVQLNPDEDTYRKSLETLEGR